MSKQQNNEMYHFRYVADIFVPSDGITQEDAIEVADAFLGQLLEDEGLTLDDIFRIRVVRNTEHYVDEDFVTDMCFGDAADDEDEDDEDEDDEDEEDDE